MKKGKSMADENQMDQGPAVPPQAKEREERGATHAREAAEDLRSAAGAMADEYRGRAEGVWDDALHRVRSFQDESNTFARTRRRRSLLRWGSVSCLV